MSSFWHWWIIVIVLGSIFGCVWLIKWTEKPGKGESKIGETTGHAYDGIEEYNNPLPRWWLGLFYITIVFALVYLVLYPGLGNFDGVLGWTKENQYEREMRTADDTYGPVFAQFASQDLETLAADEEAQKVGRRLFLTYCAQCHGSDAQGADHFPNLADNDWLYGGAPETIKKTIMDGRRGVMPAFGPPLGGEAGVEAVANYVLSLSGRKHDEALAAEGKKKFMTFCTGCHGADAKGNQMLGAPNLTDDTWLHGKSKGAIVETITLGRNNMMPAHREFLGEDKVHLLAAYVYGLSD